MEVFGLVVPMIRALDLRLHIHTYVYYHTIQHESVADNQKLHSILQQAATESEAYRACHLLLIHCC